LDSSAATNDDTTTDEEAEEAYRDARNVVQREAEEPTVNDRHRRSPIVYRQTSWHRWWCERGSATGRDARQRPAHDEQCGHFG
jgi:hypothetical protein